MGKKEGAASIICQKDAGISLLEGPGLGHYISDFTKFQVTFRDQEMIGAISKAIGQLPDPKMRSVFIKGVIGAVIVLAVLYVVIAYLFSHVILAEVPLIGWLFEYEWVVAIIDVASGFFFGGVFLTITYFLFPPIMVAVMGIFLDQVCDAVESHHYPGLGEPRFIPTMESIIGALKFLGMVILINLLALPFYIMTLWVAGLGIFLYYAINGYLFGREYFELVSHRRVNPQVARNLRKSNGFNIFLLGCVAAFGMTIPILNLFVPIIAAAAMVHVFMKVARNTPLEGGRDSLPEKTETTFP